MRMCFLLYPLAAELKNSDMISVQTSQNEFMCFRISILLFSCDILARTAIANLIGPNGYFGCPYCYQKGEGVPNSSAGTTVRCPKEDNLQLRTHDETIHMMKRIVNENLPQLKGIKGVSSILLFPSGYDIINSFSIDYMHGIAMGIAKDLIKISMGKRQIPKPPYERYKLTPQNRELLSDRILNLKPTKKFRRLPRSL